MFAFTLPMVLLTLPAGAILDRVDRKRVMLACEAGRGLAVASLAFGIWAGWLTFAQVLVVAVVDGIAYPFFRVGERSALRHLVSAPQLPAAMAQLSAREFTGLAAGQTLGGLLFGLGRLLPFVADAFSYLMSLVSLLLIRGQFNERRSGVPRALHREIGEGLAWVWRHRFVRTTALLSAGLVSVTNALYLAVIVAALRRGATPAMSASCSDSWAWPAWPGRSSRLDWPPRCRRARWPSSRWAYGRCSHPAWRWRPARC